jgi:cystathionine beta-lyase family protein involved in aluminum resistance
MGSLIKSPGGTIVPGGGYIAGRADLIAAAAARLTAPGVGMDAGCVSGSTLRLMAQGSPHTSALLMISGSCSCALEKK